MSFSLTFTELVNVAIPQCGVVNFQALHYLLHGILEQSNLAESRRHLSGEEDFLNLSLPQEGDSLPIVSPVKKIHNVFDQLVGRMDKMESQLTVLQDMSSAHTPQGSSASSRVAQDLWTTIKIRKMVEANEEAVAKARPPLLSTLGPSSPSCPLCPL